MPCRLQIFCMKSLGLWLEFSLMDAYSCKYEAKLEYVNKLQYIPSMSNFITMNTTVWKTKRQINGKGRGMSEMRSFYAHCKMICKNEY